MATGEASCSMALHAEPPAARTPFPTAVSNPKVGKGPQVSKHLELWASGKVVKLFQIRLTQIPKVTVRPPTDITLATNAAPIV